MQINIDGLPLFKSSNVSLWPILAIIKEENPDPFPVGIWCGQSKPNSANDFLKKIVDEMKDISVVGTTINNNHVAVTIANFTCDTPAKAFIKCMKGHSGYHGCDYCTDRRVYLEHRMTFPNLEAPLRTDIAFGEMSCQEHHNSDTILRQLKIELVSKFPIHYMHLECLGIMKKFISMWSSGPLLVRLGIRTIKEISPLQGFPPKCDRISHLYWPCSHGR